MVQAACFYELLCGLWPRCSGSPIERALIVLIWLSICAATAFVRLRIETHWPSDVLGGLVVGAAWLAALVRALKLGDRSSLAA